MNFTKLGDKILRRNDSSRSEKLVAQIAELEKGIQAMLDQYHRLDDEACAIAARLVAAKAAASPQTAELDRELLAARQRRDAVKVGHQHKRDLLTAELETITAPAIRAFTTRCQQWFQEIDDARRAEAEEQVYDGSADAWRVSVSNNSRVVKEARSFVQNALRTVVAMRWRPLAEILDRIAALEKEFATFDLDEVESDVLSRELAGDLAHAGPRAGQQDFAQITPSDAKGSGGAKILRVDRPH